LEAVTRQRYSPPAAAAMIVLAVAPGTSVPFGSTDVGAARVVEAGDGKRVAARVGPVDEIA
jgi:hypothetical protein